MAGPKITIPMARLIELEKAEHERDLLGEQLQCVRQALPEEWRGSVLSVAVATLSAERARYAPLMQAVEWLLEDGHMNQEHLARLRSAWGAEEDDDD